VGEFEVIAWYQTPVVVPETQVAQSANTRRLL
jgi:hypothetical protein